MAPLPGDPAALRAGAAKLRVAAVTAREATWEVQSARGTADGGWKGGAAAAFGRAAGGTQQRVGALERLSEAAAPLETYAAELEAAQRTWNAHYDTAVHGYGTPGYRPAVLALSAARNAARAANERCAAEIARIAALVRDGHATQQAAQKQGGQLVGTTVGALETNKKIDAELAERRYDPAARSLAGDAARWTRLGNALNFVGPAVEQLVSDADNPHYSNAERAGRAVAQGGTVGLASVAGAAAAGAMVGSVVPGLGTVVGGVVGFAAGAIGGYLAGEAADSLNDGFVDGIGEATDALFSW